MTSRSAWQILVVDDDKESAEGIREILTEEELPWSAEVDICVRFDEALERLDTQRFDLLILDLRDGSGVSTSEDPPGMEVLQSLRSKRFVPVVFYTAVPNYVSGLENAFIRIVTRGEMDALEKLRSEVSGIFETRLPGLVRHLEEEQRRYMWDFVSEHIGDLPEGDRNIDLAYLLARRLAALLRGPSVRKFLASEMAQHAAPSKEIEVHPMDFYIFPPIADQFLSGDIFLSPDADFWILLTPSCDLAGRKRTDTQYVQLARCLRLVDQPECRDWREALNGSQGRMKSLLKNRRGQGYQPERYFFLPGILDLPDLLVDFQQLKVVEMSTIASREWDRKASLDSPFAEEFLNRFARFFGRIGTPDLDLDVVFGRLRSTSLQKTD